MWLGFMKNQWDMDTQNDRVVAYLPKLNDAEVERVISIQKDSSPPGKVIIYTREEKVPELEQLGFSCEANMSGFFEGELAYIYTKYYKHDRSISRSVVENNDSLRIVQADIKKMSTYTGEFEFSLVEDQELENLAKLYQKVFPVYSTNIFEPSYLKKSKESNFIYMVAKDTTGAIVGAASAMETGYGSAEITDCAVDPDYRGKNVLHYLIQELENELLQREIHHVFSITRAKSVGMNMTVKRLGYNYEGTLTNNCIISSGFEDMNIWTKKIGE